MSLSPVSWLLAAVAAILVGLSKTGMPGVAIPSVWLMAEAFGPEAKLSVGAITPLLVVADVFAVAYYRRHAQWDQLWRLLPYIALGMVPAMLLLDRTNSAQLRPILGGLIVALLILDACRKWFGWENMPSAWWFVGATGFLAGFGTALGNAAGPVMAIYFLAMRMPKEQFMGTSAWLFFLVNTSKLIPYGYLGVITAPTLSFDLWLVPVVVLSSLAGAAMLPHIPQRIFDGVVLALAAVGGVRLMLG